MRVRSAFLLLLVLVASVSVLPGCSDPTVPGIDAGLPEVDGGGTADANLPDARPSDPCEPNPCTEPNRAVCTAPLDVAECRCDPGYEERGGACERVTPCEPGLCGEHGTCEMGDGGPECVCELGHAGEHCELCDEGAGYYDDGTGRCTLDACSPSPCTDPTRMLCTGVDRRAVCGCNAGTHDEGGTCVPDATCMP